jgi:hypothetical protein
MPGTPHHSPAPAQSVTSAHAHKPERLSQAESELMTLLQRLSVDVERLAASRAPQGRATRLPQAAPHYHFHFMAKTLMEDGEGKPFPSAEVALRHARTLAAQLSESGLLSGCSILVARDDEVLFEVPLSHAMN